MTDKELVVHHIHQQFECIETKLYETNDFIQTVFTLDKIRFLVGLWKAFDCAYKTHILLSVVRARIEQGTYSLATGTIRETCDYIETLTLEEESAS